jgi:parallel beta-helix repeat protein
MIIIVLFTGGVVHPRAATAATYYTATTGSDSNLGTLAQPFRTIKKGIGVLKAGDTLYLRAGTYMEKISQLSYPIPSGTSFNNSVTIAGYPNETVTIQAGIDITTARYLIFKDFVILGDGVAIGSGRDAQGFPSQDNFLRFQNIEVHHWQGADTHGFFVNSNHNEFLNVKVHDSPTDPANRHHGYYIQGAYNLLDGGEIYNCTGYGIQLYNGYWSGGNGGPVHDNIVRNVRIHNNGGSSNSGGIVISKGNNNLVYNNVIYNIIHNGSGIDVNYDATNTKIYNNTIYSNSGYGIFIGSSSSGTSVKNNIIYRNISPIRNDGSGTNISHNSTTDPAFINTGTNDFRLQSTSLAIDAGTSINEVTVDCMGVPRPQGAGYDIGAYEYQGLRPPAPRTLSIISVTP